jgi:hypothetical protein
MMADRGELGIVGPPQITLNYYTFDRGHPASQVIDGSDWLVVVDGEPSILTDDDFQEEFFSVTERVESDMPELKDLLT